MPYPTDVYRCNINAVVGGEIMVHTVWVKDRAAAVGTTIENVARSVRDAWKVWWDGATPAIPTGLVGYLANVSYLNVTAYEVGADGRAIAQAEAPFTNMSVGPASARLPSHLSVVVSLQTGQPGRSNRGRLYLGALRSSMLDTAGTLSPATQENLALGAAEFYKRIRNNPFAPDNYDAAVVSPKLGTSRPITSVRVGNVFDVMNSRRNRIVESYNTKPVG